MPEPVCSKMLLQGILAVLAVVSVIGCRGKKMPKPGKGPPCSEGKTAKSVLPEKPLKKLMPSKNEEEKVVSVKKTQENVKEDDKTQEDSNKIQPTKLKKTDKEEKIAKGLVRDKLDYPTFGDIESSWSSEKKVEGEKNTEEGGKKEEEKVQKTAEEGEKIPEEKEKGIDS